ncbi:MAG TPA: aspartate/glutamate racemase family protein [Longimicrobium sp.]|jgi:aspartate racemase|uniref:aspartate/glutamate racemase family protein n=1 Tax=Longimicrobium sp. TaxID=2029185 RepID=UPI002EDB131E
MRVIGLLGGMSWESTAEYYRIINQEVRRRVGGQHSARIVMYSVDFNDVAQLQHAGDWDGCTALLADGARRLKAGGADFALLCTNTMHKVLPQAESEVDLPFVHIADATAAAIRAAGKTRVALLGTRFTMEHDFYHARLADSGIETLIPGEVDRETVHRVIYDELVQGVISGESRREYVRIIRALADRGAEGVILGCTEIPLLVGPDDSPVPLFDTTRIHAEAAVDRALA